MVQVMETSTEQRDAFRAAVKELKDLGYLTVEKISVADGKFTYKWSIKEAITVGGFTVDGKTVDGKPTSITYSNKHKTIEDQLICVLCGNLATDWVLGKTLCRDCADNPNQLKQLAKNI